MRPGNLIGLLAFGRSPALAQSLLDVLRDHGFTGYADLLEGDPILDAGPGIIVYAPGNAVLSAAANPSPARAIQSNSAINSFGTVRDTAPTFEDPAVHTDPGDDGDAETPPGTLRETLLNDPVFVNLGPGRNQSLIERNVSSARPTLVGGLGKTVAVVGDDIPFDGGVIRPIDGFVSPC